VIDVQGAGMQAPAQPTGAGQALTYIQAVPCSNKHYPDPVALTWHQDARVSRSDTPVQAYRSEQ
jgi:hypothetical protein